METTYTHKGINQTILNTKGMSIIQVIVATGILGIIMAGFTSYMVSAQRQQSQIAMKMDLNDLKGQIAQALSKPANCISMMTTSNFLYNASANPPPSFQNQINAIVDSSNPGAAAVTVATKGQRVPISPLLNVNSINVENISGTGNNLTAELVVDVQPRDPTAMRLRPIRFADMSITMTTVGGSKVVDSCFAGQTFLQGNGGGGTADYAKTINFPTREIEFKTPGQHQLAIPNDSSGIIMVTLVGGGGGGGVSNNNNAGGGGGGGGGQVDIKTLKVTPGSSITIVVGKGGASNTDGGDTKVISAFGTILVNGGKSGETPQPNSGVGGNGGSVGGIGYGASSGSSGIYTMESQQCWDGANGNVIIKHGGAGGSSFGGNGGVSVKQVPGFCNIPGQCPPGNSTSNIGAGGGGAACGNGGSGGPGYVKITY